MLLNDENIRGLCVDDPLEGLSFVCGPFGRLRTNEPLIDPFSEAVSGNGVISYGLTSAGYDLRLAPELEIFKNASGEVLDVKRFSDPEYRRRMLDSNPVPFNWGFVLPPGNYALGRSVEYLRIPRFLKARCVGKSTLARAGILINTTPLEPGWEGHLTIEIGNVTNCPAVLYPGEGIAQLEFELLTAPPQIDYAQKGGKYQRQRGVTPAKVE